MRPGASRYLFVTTAMCLSLASSGCSLVFSRGPDIAPTPTTAGSPGECSGSVGPPVVDTVLFGTHLVSAFWALGEPKETFGGSSGVRGAVIAADLGLAAIHIASAIHGYSSSASCREARARQTHTEDNQDPLKTFLALEKEVKAREREVVVVRPFEVVWTAWLTEHEATACLDALRLLRSESGCAGAACRAPLLLSSGYQKNCSVDTDTRMFLYRMSRRWEEAAGKTKSECLEETYLALTDPAKATMLPERCSNEGKTEAALRDAARRRPAEPNPPAPSTAE